MVPPLSSAVSLGTYPLSWSVAGVGDFNGDGFSDLLFIDTNGDIAIWFMKGPGDIGAVSGHHPDAMVGCRHRRFQR